MKIAILIARILLGLAFFASGLISVLNLMKSQPMPGDAGMFATILLTHRYMTFIGLLEVIAGVLLLVGRFVPIALVLLGPILVNILLFHILMPAPGIIPGLVLTLLELFLIWAYRLSFRGLFDAAPEVA
jgi:uncharacterized membrane protein YphA (DoxX/SURF4 family)